MHKFRITETVNTNVSEKKIRKLHKFATTNSNFEKNQLFQPCIIVRISYMYINF